MRWRPVEATPPAYSIVRRFLQWDTTSKTHLLGQESHGKCFVQESQFAILALLVVGVTKDAAIEQCAMHVGDHGSNVSGGIWSLVLVGGKFDRVEIVDNGRIKVLRVPFIN
jgi:hypothetical protein